MISHPDRPRTSTRPAAPALLALAVLTVSACSPAASAAAAPPATPARTATSTAAADPAVTRAAAVVASMTLRQRVGQMLAVGVPSAQVTTASALVTRYGVGTVFLSGRDTSGVASVGGRDAQLQRAATAAATGGVLEFVAVDQEGGAVQSLRGPGLSDIPSAVAQSRETAATIRYRAALWSRQLRRAGVTLDLAPVTDVVPPAHQATNQPIARYHRQFGSSEAGVAAAVGPWAAGSRSAGVQPTLKHFPGLGRVIGNTDTTARVVDSETTRSAATLVPWRAGVAGGAGAVMVSSAIYARIDGRGPAVFSPQVVGGMLRHDMAFGGVVMTDDVGNAAAVRSVPVGERASRFVSAGGDLVLTLAPSQIPTMSAALMDFAVRSPVFAAQVKASATRVLTLKYRTGLLR